MGEKEKIDELQSIYEKFDDEGKERVISVVEEYLKSGQKGVFMGDVKTVEIKKMSKEEINMWSILIAVLKNQGKEYKSIDSIIQDISDIKEMIRLLK